jgi:hypothetical protein
VELTHEVSIMVRILSTAAIALSLTVGLTAQQGTVKERTKIETDDAKVVTWMGCLRASADGFDLTEVTRDTSGDTRKKSRTPNIVMLREVPATLDLKRYVGHRVAITGATEKDVFEDIEVEVQTERTVAPKARPDVETKTKAEVEADPKGHNILVPISVREISKTCR